MSEITITITGDNELLAYTNKLSKDLMNPQEPLLESANYYYEEILQNFKTRGRTFNETWQPLRKSTIEQKRKLKEEGKAIAFTIPLVRTGKMREGFSYGLNSRFSSSVFNVMNYVKKHDEGIGTPKRVISKIDIKRVNTVVRIFDRWLDRLLNKYEGIN